MPTKARKQANARKQVNRRRRQAIRAATPCVEHAVQATCVESNARTVDDMNTQKISSWHLPHGTRLHLKKRMFGVLVVETKPMCRSVLCHHTYCRYISFPYIVWIVTYYRTWIIGKVFSSLHLGFRSSPLTSTDDKIYPAPIPNYYTDMRVCLSAKHNWFAYSFFISKLYYAAATQFWNTGFTGDCGGFWPDNNARSFDKWAESTMKDKDFAMKFNWDSGDDCCHSLHNFWPALIPTGMRLEPVKEDTCGTEKV